MRRHRQASQGATQRARTRSMASFSAGLPVASAAASADVQAGQARARHAATPPHPPTRTHLERELRQELGLELGSREVLLRFPRGTLDSAAADSCLRGANCVPQRGVDGAGGSHRAHHTNSSAVDGVCDGARLVTGSVKHAATKVHGGSLHTGRNKQRHRGRPLRRTTGGRKEERAQMRNRLTYHAAQRQSIEGRNVQTQALESAGCGCSAGRGLVAGLFSVKSLVHRMIKKLNA